ncbi:MAG: PAS domain-containing sensor histidine kinase [Euryarchaeota archaeon]|nr:PAS domain-containing sensor histidine kinase [Euryarchaeota archaeon]
MISLADIPLHSTNLLSLLDEDGVIHYQSPSIERLLGFDQDELLGVSCTEVFHPDDREAVYDAFKNVVASDGSDEFVVEAIEYRHLMGDGSYRWVESVTSSDPTADGYYVINTRDISTQRQQRHALERANERLTKFATIVTHDLRNPLSVVTGRLRRARKSNPSEALDAMVEPLDRMARMIDKLRTLTTSQRRTITTTAVPIAARAETAWSSTETGDSELRVQIDPGVEYEADFGLLDHIFENLFRNAVVHNPEPVTVTVGSLGERAGFYVADDGNGIPAEQAEAVLEYGYSTAGAGTGVGLTIVSDFVAAHGWELEIFDAADGGARFEIYTD